MMKSALLLLLVVMVALLLPGGAAAQGWVTLYEDSPSDQTRTITVPDTADIMRIEIRVYDKHCIFMAVSVNGTVVCGGNYFSGVKEYETGKGNTATYIIESAQRFSVSITGKNNLVVNPLEEPENLSVSPNGTVYGGKYEPAQHWADGGVMPAGFTGSNLRGETGKFLSDPMIRGILVWFVAITLGGMTLFMLYNLVSDTFRPLPRQFSENSFETRRKISYAEDATNSFADDD